MPDQNTKRAKRMAMMKQVIDDEIKKGSMTKRRVVLKFLLKVNGSVTRKKAEEYFDEWKELMDFEKEEELVKQGLVSPKHLGDFTED